MGKACSCNKHECSNVHDKNHSDHSHDHDHDSGGKLTLVKIVISLACLITGFLIKDSGIPFYIVTAIGYLSVGIDIIINSVKNIMNKEFFDEYFLLAIASIGAIILGEYLEAVAVTLFFTVGTYFEGRATQKSKDTIKSLTELQPETVEIYKEGKYVITRSENAAIGDLFRVSAGSRIPLDGVVAEGSSNIDTSSLTGESVPVYAEPGSKVKSGCIVMDGSLMIRAENTLEESTVSRILRLTQDEESKKAKSVSFITRFSKIYTPAVIAASALLAIFLPLFFNVSYSQSIYRALSFLVIACPCALVISVPLTFFSAIGRAAKSGVIIKGGVAVEKLADYKIAVFDKTGTLTDGTFEIERITGEDTLELAAYAEEYSNHPIAVCVKNNYKKEIDYSRIDGYKEHAGMGISVMLDGRELLCGSGSLMDKFNIDHEENGANLYIAYDGIFKGEIFISDKIKGDAIKTVADLKAQGVKSVYILSGDNSKNVDKIKNKIPADVFIGSLMPDQKVEKVHEIKKQGRTLFVGDGINDAPVLTAADVGIAMGGIGSEAAISAADAVIMGDELNKIPQMKKLALKTLGTVRFNIIFSISVKLAILVLAAIGIVGMWAAVFADVGVSIIAILNSLRIMRAKLTK